MKLPLDDDQADVPAKRARRPKRAPETDGTVVRLEQRFVEAHQRMWGCTPTRDSVPYERRILKELAVQFGEEEVNRLVDRFFADRRRRCNYTILDFKREVPAMRLEEQRRHGGDERTRDNMDAAARAAGRRPR